MIRVFQRILASMLVLGCLASVSLQSGWANIEPVPMKKLQVKDIVYLPTVKSAREILFTKPKTWQLAGDSYVKVDFQHSHELLPNRSWLEVLINDKVQAHVPLTAENSNGTTLKVPLPVGLLKDFNKLTFRVEQHYTDVCEDPLDPSLWTQILPSSQIVFSYTPVLPKVDLASYPYPIIDPLSYSPAQVHYVLPAKAALDELQAMTLVNLHLGQAAQKKVMGTGLSLAGQRKNQVSNTLYIGTPTDNPDLASLLENYPSIGEQWLSGDAWLNPKTQQPLGAEEGLILYLPHPAEPNKAVVIVSGNTPKGVLQAARYLTTPPLDEGPHGSVAWVPANWSPPERTTVKKPRYIDTEGRTFAELGLPIQAVAKINAPPITYKFPVAGDFSNPEAKLLLDLVYSYGPGANPEYSSLEVRMNDISIGSVPLQNKADGEESQRVTFRIPNELIRPKNEMVVQFHLLPDKFGRCKNNYVDLNWGKIQDDSAFRVEGPVKLRLPELALLRDTGFPYSRKDNFEETHIVLPENPTPAVLQTLLGVTTRLGRITDADSDLRVTLGMGKAELPKDKDILMIGQDAGFADLQNTFILNWPMALANPLLKQFRLTEKDFNKIWDNGLGGYIEQRLTPWKNTRAITLLSAKSSNGFLALSNLFEAEEKQNPPDEEIDLGLGSLKQISPQDEALNAVDYPRYVAEKGPLVPWYSQLPWLQIIGILLGGFILLLLLPLLMSRFRRR